MAEAVVVLNGNETERYERLQTALDIQYRYGSDLIVSGGFNDADYELISKEFSDRSGGVLLAERSSRDTIGNALWSTTDFLKQREYEHIWLVTSDYHIERARWLFATVNDGELDIENQPVQTTYESDKELRLRQKERLLAAVGGIILWNCDFRVTEGFETAKRRVKNVFRRRYKNTS